LVSIVLDAPLARVQVVAVWLHKEIIVGLQLHEGYPAAFS
jgi:hypothetical protein